jgi:cephalosporin-C deacetylase
MALFDMPLEELRRYAPALTREADFDAFWERTLAESARTPLDLRLTPLELPYRNAKLYRATFAGWGGAEIVGTYATPAGDGPFPAIALYHGYSGRGPEPWNLLAWTSQGYAVLATDVRGQGGLSSDNAGYPGGHAPGFMTMGISDPERYYYRAVYVDTARAVEALASRPEVDAGRIGATGGRQGGALTLVAAALDSRVRAIVSEIPFLCHFRRATTLVDTAPYKEIREYFRRTGADEDAAYRTLSYFDCMNLAPRIQAASLVTIGLMDDICPPSTCFAAFNHIAGDKEALVNTFAGHETFPGVLEARAGWFAAHLG